MKSKRSNKIVLILIILTFSLWGNYYSNERQNFSDEEDISAIYNGLPENGIFNRWFVLGPILIFEDQPGPEAQDSLIKAFETNYLIPSEALKSIEAKKQKIDNSIYTWQLVNSENRIINLIKEIGELSHAIAYAYAQINMPEDKEVLLGIGSNDAVKLWVNQNLVHSNWVERGVNIDDDLVPVKLKKGMNEILLKVQNLNNDWGFTCRVVPSSQFGQRLLFFSERGNIENVKQLLNCGADINVLSDLGLTPLQTSQIFGHKDLAGFLIEKGADTINKMPSKEEIVDYYFNNIVRKEFPGAAVLISRDGKILHKKAYGYANLEHEVPFKTTSKFRIASVTKQFTAAAILKLQEQGLLNVNDNISKYLPYFPDGDNVTIHHLLTHTSGIQNDWNEEFVKSVIKDPEAEDLVGEMKKLKYDFKPGEKWNYSNCGYIALGFIIEKVSGLSYLNFLKRTFFEPLGMNNTGIYQWNAHFAHEIVKDEVTGYCKENGTIYKIVDFDRYGASGVLYSTVEDLFKWNEAVFNHKVLNETSFKAAFSPVQTEDGSPKQYGFDYGYGWFIRKFLGFTNISHGGAINGYQCEINRIPDKNLNIIIFMNRFPFSPPGINSSIASEKIARIYLWEEMNKKESFSDAH